MKAGCTGLGQVEELDVERKGHVVPDRAGVDHRATAEGHHHQQLLLRPNPELAGGDPDLTRIGRSDLTDNGRVRRIGDVRDQDPRVRVRTVSGFVPTTVKLSDVPGIPPPDPTVTSPSAANGNASVKTRRDSPTERRFIGSPFSPV